MMKVDTYPEERMVYVELVAGAVSSESREVSDGIVVDYDDAGRPIGIEIDVASIPALLPLPNGGSSAK
jgi:uncharacterized protein YuzE